MMVICKGYEAKCPTQTPVHPKSGLCGHCRELKYQASLQETLREQKLLRKIKEPQLAGKLYNQMLKEVQ